MSITITKVKGPTIVQADGVKYTLSLALDTSFATGGENVDLTSYLSTLTKAAVCGADAVADVNRRYAVVGPGVTTTLTSTNVKLMCYQSSGTSGVDVNADAVDLTSVGALIIEVTGKQAIPTSWA